MIEPADSRGQHAGMRTPAPVQAPEFHPESDGLWHRIDERNGILVADYSVSFFPVPVRSIAFRLASGGYALYSPGLGLEKTFNAGPVEYLIAANSMHHLGCKAWQTKFPTARLVAAPAAQERLAKRGGHTNFYDFDAFARDVETGTEIRVYAVPHIKSGDVIVSLPTQLSADTHGNNSNIERRAWVSCDTILNITTRPRRFWQLWMVKILDEYPGLKTPLFLLAFVPKRDRSAYVEWFRMKLAQDQPSVLIPSHGEIHIDPTNEPAGALTRRLDILLGHRFL